MTVRNKSKKGARPRGKSIVLGDAADAKLNYLARRVKRSDGLPVANRSEAVRVLIEREYALQTSERKA
jgi:hypothetical protein